MNGYFFKGFTGFLVTGPFNVPFATFDFSEAPLAAPSEEKERPGVEVGIVACVNNSDYLQSVTNRSSQSKLLRSNNILSSFPPVSVFNSQIFVMLFVFFIVQIDTGGWGDTSGH